MARPIITDIIVDGRKLKTKSAYARKYGRHLRTVARHISKGYLKKCLIKHDGKIWVDYLLAEEELKQNMHPDDYVKSQINSSDDRKPEAKIESQDFDLDEKVEQAPPASSSYITARAEKEKYNSQLTKLKYEKEAGTLVSREVVEEESRELGRLLRDAILNIPSRISAQLTALTDQGAIEFLLDKEFRQALEELVSQGERNVETSSNGEELSHASQAIN